MWRLIGAACLALGLAGAAEAEEIDQRSAVLVEADCVDPATGAVTPGTGSGVIVTADGYLVTAWHVVECWAKQPPTDQANHPLKVRVGSVFEPERAVSIVRTDAEADYAILKIEGLAADYVPATVCILRRPEAGTTAFTAVGFPMGQEYQPSAVQYGNNVGNFWGVSGALTFGMSGGGVYFEKRLVGIVKGGDPAAGGAINKISPIFRVAGEIEDETGHDPILVCSVLDNLPAEEAPDASAVNVAAEAASEGVRAAAPEPDAGGAAATAGAVIAHAWFAPSDQPKVIPVCWENPSDADILQRGIALDAVVKSWGRYSDVAFVGWERCAPESAGVRVRIEDTWPHSMGVGRQLDGRKDGVVVNLAFNSWAGVCKEQLENCIRSTVVHEFGHVLGFGHEQDRADAPAECRERSHPERVAAGPFLTPYDPESVMNFCNDVYATGGALSWYDIVKVQAVYGAPG